MINRADPGPRLPILTLTQVLLIETTEANATVVPDNNFPFLSKRMAKYAQNIQRMLRLLKMS